MVNFFIVLSINVNVSHYFMLLLSLLFIIFYDCFFSVPKCAVLFYTLYKTSLIFRWQYRTSFKWFEGLQDRKDRNGDTRVVFGFDDLDSCRNRLHKGCRHNFMNMPIRNSESDWTKSGTAKMPSPKNQITTTLLVKRRI